MNCYIKKGWGEKQFERRVKVTKYVLTKKCSKQLKQLQYPTASKLVMLRKMFLYHKKGTVQTK